MDFRSPGNRPSPRIGKQDIADGPIQDFTTVIQCTISEDWQKRTSAFTGLVAMIPASYENSTHDDWYNSAPTLRHLAKPVSELLKDARSTVVKRACQALSELFSKCKSDARYLFKDLMPAVCQIHGCTVQVIRNYIQTMVLETFAKMPCKMAMPVWLDRLKNDKSRTVREACALYLSTAMTEWGATDDLDFENENNGYLSKEIYHQVGVTLIKSLRDPSPIVRQNSKKGLEVLASQNRAVLDELVNDNNLTRDSRVMKLLRRLQGGETGIGDEMSVSSRRSNSSRKSQRSIASAPVTRKPSSQRSLTTNRRGVPPRVQRPVGGSSYQPSPTAKIPTTIGVASSGSKLGPPRRIVSGKSPQSTMKPKKLSKSLPKTPPIVSNPISASPKGMSLSTPTKRLLGPAAEKELSTPLPPTTPVTPLEYEVERDISNHQNESLVDNNEPLFNQSFDSADTDVSVLKPIATAEELRQKAKTRSNGPSMRRRSSLLQGRLLRSPKPPGMNSHTNGGKIVTALDVSHLTMAEITNHPSLPIHTKIAYELLEVHKLHVDQIMETLKVEMDALRDFELIMLEKGPLRPTEEEVLEYFESLGLCLEQRRKAGAIMQKKMDRISQG